MKVPLLSFIYTKSYSDSPSCPSPLSDDCCEIKKCPYSGEQLQSRFRSCLIALVILLLTFLGSYLLNNELFTAAVLCNLLNDSAGLLLAAVGVTFVMAGGGMDLSGSGVCALTSLLSAQMLSQDISPLLVIPTVLLPGILLGTGMGALITRYSLSPFSVTLAGQILFRGICRLVSDTAIPISDVNYKLAALAKIRIGSGKIYVYTLVALVITGIFLYVLQLSLYGKKVYATGCTGADKPKKSDQLIRISTYTLSGFLASLAGVLYSIQRLSAAPGQNAMLSLEAMGSAVIGGAVFGVSSGSVGGTLLGVLSYSIIASIVRIRNISVLYQYAALLIIAGAIWLIKKQVVRTKKTSHSSRLPLHS